MDPIGRKEILDTLSSVREQTTVLFSTHVLSDVERICTDVAFLNDGVISMCGKLSEVKLNRRGDEYLLQTTSADATDGLISAFARMKRIGENQVSFYESEHSVFEVMSFISANRVPIVKLERKELTLESLFMEVLEK